ncbi:MAG: GNAT family N-acetyltransferase, partial [Mesorhizobium sp.]
MTEITVRPLAQSDHADWQRLWTAYLTFYET